jgi:hypothetical protein
MIIIRSETTRSTYVKSKSRKEDNSVIIVANKSMRNTKII